MMTWDVEPHIGAGLLLFEMTEDEVASKLGPPVSTRQKSNLKISEYRDETYPTLHYVAGRLKEISFNYDVPNVIILGVPYFETAPAKFLHHVGRRDPDLRRTTGGDLISFALGIAFDNFDLDANDKGLTAFSKGMADDILVESTRFFPQKL